MCLSRRGYCVMSIIRVMVMRLRLSKDATSRLKCTLRPSMPRFVRNGDRACPCRGGTVCGELRRTLLTAAFMRKSRMHNIIDVYGRVSVLVERWSRDSRQSWGKSRILFPAAPELGFDLPRRKRRFSSCFSISPVRLDCLTAFAVSNC